MARYLKNFLGASPLRLYGQESIVAVQCPVKVFGKTFDEALSNRFKKWVPFLKKTPSGEIEINTKSSWYVEIQGQLHVSGEIEDSSDIKMSNFVFKYFRKEICLCNSLAGVGTRH